MTSSIRLPILLFVLASGVLAGCAARSAMDSDEDRPPILVRGGSIIFESGATGRPGKPWMVKDDEFFQDHETGRHVSAFQLYFTGGQGECRPSRTSSFTVAFDHDGEAGTSAKLYTVTIRRPPTGMGRPGPTVTGEGLNVDKANARRISAWDAGKGSIVSVRGDDFTCKAPTEVWVESIRVS